jgi:hypothetical protein
MKSSKKVPDLRADWRKSSGVLPGLLHEAVASGCIAVGLRRPRAAHGRDLAPRKRLSGLNLAECRREQVTLVQFLDSLDMTGELPASIPFR